MYSILGSGLAKRLSTRSGRFVHASGVKNKPVPLRDLNESFASGTSANYVEALFEQWLVDPSSVHKSWDAYFKNVERGAPKGRAVITPGDLQKVTGGFVPSARASESTTESVLAFRLGVQVQNLIRSYQVFGHKNAKLDPLGINVRQPHSELQPERWGFTEEDMHRDISQLQEEGLSPFLSGSGKYTVADLIKDLNKTYCSTVGVEYMHIQDTAQCEMIRSHIEKHKGSGSAVYTSSPEVRVKNLRRLLWATCFEEFLHSRWTEKRFGCDGAEVIIPGMNSMVDKAAQLGVKNISIGMAHRGRLNVLTNVMHKPLPAILHEFQKGTVSSEHATGDVKYHLGTSCNRETPHGTVHLSLLANPSHLEAVNPVVEGKVACKQFRDGDEKHERTMPVLVHGDASFVGQGVVYETITLSRLRNYDTGGTIHVVLNNQIGFTTSPEDSRPGEYCTDVAKSAGAPIFHVNGDDVDAVCWVFELAVMFRQQFHKDVVVDIVCYRRFGHNEIDQPTLTQPLMYKIIEQHPKTLDLFKSQLISQGIVDEEKVQEMKQAVQARLEESMELSKTYQPRAAEWLSDNWAGFKGPEQLAMIANTGISNEKFDTVAAAITSVPSDFALHPIINRSFHAKKKMIEGGEDIDWATAEALAFGSLTLEGFNVRLSGQDVERGTFSHRHVVLHDQLNDNRYIPLNNIPGAKGQFTVTNSCLSEYAELGYELGYSLHHPNTLVLWEAQFGDFSNGAQIIIDQFISSGEQKWMRQSGLVMLLPHGYEGMGPEHSSARLERYLAMCDPHPDVIPPMSMKERRQIQTSNWQIVNCTTPANYFHVLRRQLHREFRKPLVIFTPKSLLRHPLAKSPRAAFDDVGDDTRFLRVYWEVDELLPPEYVKRVIFCTGKVYYDLLEERRKLDINNVALIRIEQLSPFPFDHVQREMSRYPNAEVVWCQEEPKNQGAWSYIYFFLKTTLKSLNDARKIKYVGRAPSASPATGSSFTHKKEQKELLSQALAEFAKQ